MPRLFLLRMLLRRSSDTLSNLGSSAPSVLEAIAEQPSLQEIGVQSLSSAEAASETSSGVGSSSLSNEVIAEGTASSSNSSQSILEAIAEGIYSTGTGSQEELSGTDHLRNTALSTQSIDEEIPGEEPPTPVIVPGGADDGRSGTVLAGPVMVPLFREKQREIEEELVSVTSSSHALVEMHVEVVISVGRSYQRADAMLRKRGGLQIPDTQVMLTPEPVQMRDLLKAQNDLVILGLL